MRISFSWLKRQIARQVVCCLVVLLAEPFAGAATATTPLPDAPQPAPAAAAPAPAQSAGQNAQPDAPQPPPSAAQQNSTQQPVGTAAAPYLKPEGVPASRPAGAAIAPAKQRRIRSIAIRVGLLVGAAIAIGTVAAASAGSPSHPH